MAANGNRPRGPYNQVTNQDRHRIIDAFENDGVDYLEVADTLGVKRHTVSVYLRQNRRDAAPRGGAHRVNVDQDMRDALVRLLDENPLLTLEQMNNTLRRLLPNKPVISSISTLARTLDGMFMTIKPAEDIPGGGRYYRRQKRAESSWPKSWICSVFFESWGSWALHLHRRVRVQYLDQTNIRKSSQRWACPKGCEQPVRKKLQYHICNIQRNWADSPLCQTRNDNIGEFPTVYPGHMRRSCSDAVQILPADEPIHLIYDNARPHINTHLH